MVRKCGKCCLHMTFIKTLQTIMKEDMTPRIVNRTDRYKKERQERYRHNKRLIS